MHELRGEAGCQLDSLQQLAVQTQVATKGYSFHTLRVSDPSHRRRSNGYVRVGSMQTLAPRIRAKRRTPSASLTASGGEVGKGAG